MSSPELDLPAAFALLNGAIEPVTAVEQVATARAAGRVLAADVASTVDVPAFDAAAMDGYALRSSDTVAAPLELQVVGRVLAGSAFGARISAGQCVRIMTGAPMPQDGDAILVLEEAELRADRLRVKVPVAAGRHCRIRGEHVSAGETVLQRGRRLRGTDLGLAASAGVATLAVFRRLRVGVLSTGDELVDPPEPLIGARIYDANRAFLLAALERDGTEAFDLGIVGDSAGALAALLAHAEQLELDAIITTGGAAQGDADVVRRTSGVQYVPLAIRPGRGLAFAQRMADRPLVLLGLPGNAVAAFVVFQLLARPATRRLAGELAQLPRAIPLPLASNLDCKPGRVDFQRARLVPAPSGGLAVLPLAQQGSAMLRTISEADALVAIGPAPSYRAGDLVDAFLLSALE